MDRRDRVLKTLRVAPGTKTDLAGRDTRWSGGGELDQLSKHQLDKTAKNILARGVDRLQDAQELLWASDSYALLDCLPGDGRGGEGLDDQARDVRREPPGREGCSFRHPSSEELDHNYLWRISNALPERGSIGIFNRSHYEEVVALRVHPEWLDAERLPTGDRGAALLGRPLRGHQRVRAPPRQATAPRS